MICNKINIKVKVLCEIALPMYDRALLSTSRQMPLNPGEGVIGELTNLISSHVRFHDQRPDVTI